MYNINKDSIISTGISLGATALTSYIQSKLNKLDGKIQGAVNGFSGQPQMQLGKIGAGGQNDIWSFLSHFEHGVAKPNRFRIELSLPSGVSGGNVGDVNAKSQASSIKGEERRLNKNGSISIKCHTMTVPPRTFQTLDVKQNNMSFKIPFGVSYDPVTFTFYADAEIDTRQYFEVWQAAVMNYSNNTMNFMNEYTSDIKLFILDDEGRDVYGVTLYEAFPLGLSMIEMSYSNDNAPLNMSVTFTYKYYLSMDSTQRVNRIF